MQMMNSVPHSLNPYATSYMPLSKRVADQTTDSFEKKKPLKDINSSEARISEAPFSSNAAVAWPSTSWHLADPAEDDEFQMNIEYLQMMFPRLSYESLAAVYLGNRGDMEATDEMLNHLEPYIEEPLGSPSETLNMGDTTVTDGSADLKLKSIKEEPVVPPSSLGNFHPNIPPH